MVKPKKGKKQPAKKPNYKVVFIRHAESQFNEENTFCGWLDCDLSTNGEREAREAGKAIKRAGLKFDVAYTSVFTRAQRTLAIILKIIEQEDLAVEKTWRLNGHHLGGLTGMNKDEITAKYGELQVRLWQECFKVPTPPMKSNHMYYYMIRNDARFANGPPKERFPLSDCLRQTMERSVLFWNETILPQLKAGKRIIISAHENSLKGFVRLFDYLNDLEIIDIHLPKGIPFVYEFDENFKPVVSMKFLGKEEAVKKAKAIVADKGKLF